MKRLYLRRGDRPAIEGCSAVVLGIPVHDRGCRVFWARLGCYGFYLRYGGINLDRHGFTLIANEYHFAKNWGNPWIVYKGDIASSRLVDRADGVEAFLRTHKRPSK